MLVMMPLAPVLHGAWGPWDELLNLLPLVVGTGLLLYLYFTRRKRRAAEDVARDGQPSAGSGAPEAVPPAEPEAKPGL
jgi:hypothetical protein